MTEVHERISWKSIEEIPGRKSEGIDGGTFGAIPGKALEEF